MWRKLPYALLLVLFITLAQAQELPPLAMRLRALAQSVSMPPVGTDADARVYGTWSAEGKLPDLYTAGLLRATAGLLPSPDVPAAAKIRQVQWTWDSSRRDPWLEVLLCSPMRCVPVTRLGLGVSQAFSGEAARAPFHWRWQVVGSGGLPTPILGGPVSLRVDWVAPTVTNH